MPIRRPAPGVFTVPSGVPYSLNFNTATVEDPLSAGGIWTNNSQGTGGNAVMGTLSNMRVALADDAVTKIAQSSLTIMTGFEDAFAFVPGFGPNIRVTATIYLSAGYTGGTNHELELIMGCSIPGADNHRWMECLWSVGGASDILSLNGNPSAFTSVGATVSTAPGSPANNDVFMAELRTATNDIRWFKNGVLALSYTGALASGLGSGGGIAAFLRSGADRTKAGFRNVLIESF